MPYLAIKSKNFITESYLSTLGSSVQEGPNFRIPKTYNFKGFMTYKDIMYYYYWTGLPSGNCEFIYNKKTGKTIQLDPLDDFIYENKTGFIPRFYTSSDDGIYTIIYPEKFLKVAKESKLAKNLDKRDQLMKLDVKSNPVIFVYQK